MRPPLRLVPWIKPPEVYRPGRRVSPLRTRGIWSWRPDTWEERLAAWEWQHPRIAFLIAALIFCGFGVFLAACLVGGWVR